MAAYDPQAERRRPRPTDADPAPVDTMLGSEPGSSDSNHRVVPDDPPRSPGVTPDPADPPPDTLLFNTGIAGVVVVVIGLLLLRHFFRGRWSRRVETVSADSL